MTPWRGQEAHAESASRRTGLFCDAVFCAVTSTSVRPHFSEGQLCGQPVTDVDRIVAGGDHSMANLRALCAWCHARKSAHEGGTAAALTRVRTARPKPTHPALEE